MSYLRAATFNGNSGDPDFSHASLQRVSFAKAFLFGADFSFANLNGASFETANIEQVKFYRANLRKANLSTTLEFDRWLSGLNDGQMGIELPAFECADLREANLSNRILAWVQVVGPKTERFSMVLYSPLFKSVAIDTSTKLSPFGIVFSVELPEGRSSNDAMALPGKYDLLDDVFGMETRGLFRQQWIQQIVFYDNGGPTIHQMLYRAGLIDHTSNGWTDRSLSYRLFTRSLSLGQWNKGTLPMLLAEGIEDQKDKAAQSVGRVRGDFACSDREPPIGDLLGVYFPK